MSNIREELDKARKELNTIAVNNLDTKYRAGLSLVNENIDRILPVNTVVYNYENFEGLKIVRLGLSETKDIFVCKAIEDTTLPRQIQKESVTINMVEGKSWNYADELPQLYRIEPNTEYELQFSKGSVFLLIFEPKISL